MGASHLSTGRRGEELAAAWYRSADYHILARNWRCRFGEADIICRRGGVLVVCEVKTRSGPRFGTPAEAVTPTRTLRLRRTAAAFLASNAAGVGAPNGFDIVRFDVAEVTGAQVNVIESAF